MLNINNRTTIGSGNNNRKIPKATGLDRAPNDPELVDFRLIWLGKWLAGFEAAEPTRADMNTYIK